MHKYVKWLILAFIIIAIFKVIISGLIPAPSMWSDEYSYARTARGIFIGEGLSAEGMSINDFPPLYPLLISIAYLFKSMTAGYLFMKIINVIISTLIIIPAYLLAREFLDEKDSFLAAILTGVMPLSVSFSPLIMTENLFFPLFTLFIYLAYKAYTSNSNAWWIAAGAAGGLCFMTRGIGITILPAIFMVSLIKVMIGIHKKNNIRELFQKEGKGALLFFTIFALVSVPWLAHNASVFGMNLSGLLGTSSNAIEKISENYYSIGQLIIWAGAYIAGTLLGTGIIFGLAFINLFKIKENKIFTFALITASCALFLILLASHQNATSSILTEGIRGKALLRYIEAIFPAIVIGGYVALKNQSIRISRKLVYICTGMLFFSIVLLKYGLFPANNSSLSFIGIPNYLLSLFIGNTLSGLIILLILIASPFAFALLYKKYGLKGIYLAVISLFIFSSLANYALIYYNSSTFWDNNENTQLGKWMDSNGIKGDILIDEEGCTARIEKSNAGETLCDKSNHASLITFWLNSRVNVGSMDKIKDTDYIISRQKLELKIIKETESGIYLYRVNQ